MADKYVLRCTAKDCKFQGQKFEAKSAADRFKRNHGGWPGHTVTIEEIKPLDKRVRVGDRIKLKEDVVKQFSADCKRLGWSVDPRAIRTVTRIDSSDLAGKHKRLLVEGPPFGFYPKDVELAWNSDEERRAGLGIRS